MRNSNNNLLYILLGLVVVIVIFFAFSSKNLDPSGQGAKSAHDVGVQTQLPPLVTNNSPGSPSSGVVLVPKECRNICRAKCGGPKPLFGITKSEKERRACHDNCHHTTCAGVSDADYNAAA